MEIGSVHYRGTVFTVQKKIKLEMVGLVVQLANPLIIGPSNWFIIPNKALLDR